MLLNRSCASAGAEPSIADMLSDPIIHALMRADGYSREDVVAIIDRVARPSIVELPAGGFPQGAFSAAAPGLCLGPIGACP
jgi:hypothetical protein